MIISVVIPTHNPDTGRFRRTLRALREQTLDSAHWETIIVDNASTRFSADEMLREIASANVRVLREPQLGLTFARRCGLSAARGENIVLVDDDNVLAPDFLAHVTRIFSRHPSLGAIGGKSLPEFDVEPQPWQREFFGLLALRDLGEAPLISEGLRPDGAAVNRYPSCAPIGAGMALRTAAARSWLAEAPSQSLPDRRGCEMSSAGDNDIVFTLLRHGWDVGYFPELKLTHLIPASRLTTPYLARLNRGIQNSWMRVLTLHAANPWPAISRWSIPLRQAKAWLRLRAWSSDAAHIRWAGACGHFEGRRSDGN